MNNMFTLEDISNMSEETLDDIIHNEDLSLEQLLVLKKNSNFNNLKDNTKIYVDEMIDDFIDVMSSENEIKEAIGLFEKYNLTNSKLNRKAKPYISNTESNKDFTLNPIIKSSGNSVYGEIKSNEINNYTDSVPIYEK